MKDAIEDARKGKALNTGDSEYLYGIEAVLDCLCDDKYIKVVMDSINTIKEA